LVPIASGRRHHGAITIRQKNAVLWGGRLRPGETVSIPDAPYVHVYVAKGAALLDEAGVLKEGDAARLTAAGGRALSADATSGAEVLIWEMGQA
jgi:redox-sensitive bicupin YhaK (pirin superfamily)